MFEQLLPYIIFVAVTGIFGTVVGFLISLITTKMKTGTQLRIADRNAQKDITLQNERLLSNRCDHEIVLERDKLEELHKILSQVQLEYSQTMSYFQLDSDMEISEFRNRYLTNCAKLSDARAIIALHFPEMVNECDELYGETNKFWGYQENILRIGINTNDKGDDVNLNNVGSAVHNISKHVHSLKNKIIYRAKQLKEYHLGLSNMPHGQ